MTSGFVWRMAVVALVLGMLAGVMTVAIRGRPPVAFANIPSNVA